MLTQGLVEGFAAVLAPLSVEDVGNVSVAATGALGQKIVGGYLADGIWVCTYDGEVFSVWHGRKRITWIQDDEGCALCYEVFESISGFLCLLRMCVDDPVNVPCGEFVDVSARAFGDRPLDAQIPVDFATLKKTHQTLESTRSVWAREIYGHDNSPVSPYHHDDEDYTKMACARANLCYWI